MAAFSSISLVEALQDRTAPGLYGRGSPPQPAPVPHPGRATGPGRHAGPV